MNTNLLEILLYFLQSYLFSSVAASLVHPKQLETFILNFPKKCTFHCLNPSNSGGYLIDGVFSKSLNPKLIKSVPISVNISKTRKSSWRTKSICTVAILDFVSKLSNNLIDKLLDTLLINRSPPQILLIHAFASRQTKKLLIRYKFSDYSLPGSIVILTLNKTTDIYTISLVYQYQWERGLVNVFIPIKLQTHSNSLLFITRLW